MQESLTNIVRHSGATQVHIDLLHAADRLKLCIQDNGCGLSVDSGRSDGFGMINMRERTTAIGGTLEIFSQPDEGTTITVTLPAHGAKAPGETP